MTYSLKDNPKCHVCGGYTTYIHDMHCQVCDNKTIVFCPNCKEHIRIEF